MTADCALYDMFRLKFAMVHVVASECSGTRERVSAEVVHEVLPLGCFAAFSSDFYLSVSCLLLHIVLHEACCYDADSPDWQR